MLNSRLFFLLLSNITLIFPAIILIYKGYTRRRLWFFAWEISIFILAGPISILYHLCDAPDIHICWANYHVLLFLDFLFSYSIITCIISPYLHDDLRLFYRLFMTILTTLLIMFFTLNTTICVTIIVICNFILFIFYHGKQLIQTPYYYPGIYIGLIFILIGTYFKFIYSDSIGQLTEQAAYQYALFHGLWHFCIGIGTTLFLCHVAIVDLDYTIIKNTKKTDQEINENLLQNSSTILPHNQFYRSLFKQRNRKLKIAIDSDEKLASLSPISKPLSALHSYTPIHSKLIEETKEYPNISQNTMFASPSQIQQESLISSRSMSEQTTPRIHTHSMPNSPFQRQNTLSPHTLSIMARMKTSPVT